MTLTPRNWSQPSPAAHIELLSLNPWWGTRASAQQLMNFVLEFAAMTLDLEVNLSRSIIEDGNV